MKRPGFLRFRRRAVALPAVPVMAGYRDPAPEHVHALRKRRAFVTLFFLTFFYAALFTILPRALALPMVLPIVAIYLFAVWALPVRSYSPPVLFERLFWGFFVSLLLWPRYLAISIPGLPWITVERLFGGPLVVMLMILASSSSPFRSEMLARLRASRGITTLVTLFAVNLVLSSFMSPNPFLTLNRLINNQINWIAIFFIAVWALRSERSVHRFVLAFLSMIVFICAIALLEFRNGGVLWANHIPSFLAVEDEMVQRILEGSYRLGSIYRVVATSTTPLSLAELLCLATPFICYLFVETRSTALRLALLVLDAVVLYCIVLTDSRMGYGGFVVGHAAYLAYFAIKVRHTQPNSIIGAALVAAMPLGAILLSTAILTVGRLRTAVLGGNRHQFSNDARADQFDAGLQIIWQSPVFGFGPGQGGPKLGYTNSAGTLTIDSYYLSILLDHGFVGFFVYYGAIIAGIVQSARIAFRGHDRRHHLSAVFAIFLLLFLITKSVLSQPTNHSLIFIALGVVVSLYYQDRQAQLRASTLPV